MRAPRRKIAGIAVATAARVSAHARPATFWCHRRSRIVAGSGIQFDDRGTWSCEAFRAVALYAVAAE
jgi:hypothetical protein